MSKAALEALDVIPLCSELRQAIQETIPVERLGLARRVLSGKSRKKDGPSMLAALEAAAAVVEAFPDDLGAGSGPRDFPAFRLPSWAAVDFARDRIPDELAQCRRIFVHGQPGVVGGPARRE